ncbi:MAG: cation diffusion facilitator family transporter [Eubacterium sp.]|nr:cation diffusion facilitator family transporter [Eubacterium sp.]
MEDLLIKKTQDKYKDKGQLFVRRKLGILAGIVGIFCNICLFAIKFAVGLIIGSMAVTADAFNNLSDAASSIMSIIGIRMSSKPADQKHPFGHGRMEYITALIIAAVILEVGLSFARQSYGKIIRPEPMKTSLAALILLALSVCVKLWLSFFNHKVGRAIDSKVMKATSADALMDAVTTTVTIISYVIFFAFGKNIDGWAGMLVSILVIWAAVGIVRDTLEPLIGQETDPEISHKVTNLVRKEKGVISTHDLVLHNYGPTSAMGTIHAELSKNLSLEEAHGIADRAEKEVMKQLGIQLVVHVDPVDPDDERVVRVRKSTERILNILDPELKLHDFQVEFGKEPKVSFDLVIPYTYRKGQGEETAGKICRLMREITPDYHYEINVDRGVVEEEAAEAVRN